MVKFTFVNQYKEPALGHTMTVLNFDWSITSSPKTRFNLHFFILGFGIVATIGQGEESGFWTWIKQVNKRTKEIEKELDKKENDQLNLIINEAYGQGKIFTLTNPLANDWAAGAATIFKINKYEEQIDPYDFRPDLEGNAQNRLMEDYERAYEAYTMGLQARPTPTEPRLHYVRWTDNG